MLRCNCGCCRAATDNQVRDTALGALRDTLKYCDLLLQREAADWPGRFAIYRIAGNTRSAIAKAEG